MLIVHLAGPFLGSMHDMRMLERSQLGDMIATAGDAMHWKRLFLFGDPGYTCDDLIMAPYREGQLTADDPSRLEFNRSMSRVRQSVEHSFGLVLTLFDGLRDFAHHKIGASAVGVPYVVAAFLTNVRLIMGGYESTYDRTFGVPRPTLEEYLRNAPTVVD